jgi:hypothetical protein
MVAPTAASGPVLAARNWKCVPAGMDRQWCATARETWPAPSSKWAIPPTIARTQTGGSRRHQGHPDALALVYGRFGPLVYSIALRSLKTCGRSARRPALGTMTSTS